LQVGAQQKPAGRGIVKLTDDALKIHREALLFDGHNDLPWQFRKRDDFAFRQFDIAKPQPLLHTDIARLKKGGVGAQFWSAYVDAESKHAVKETLEQIDVIHRMVRAYPDTFEMALTADDVVRIRKQGKIASLIGVEGGHSIDNSLGVLRTLHALGARYMTLTHTDNLDWADSATDVPRHKGLTKFGEQVVFEMNRLGMLVDISHVSADTMRHTLKVAKAPVIASHSSAFALAGHPRNVPDDVLKLVAKNNGVVMVNFYSGFITQEGARLLPEIMKTYRELRKQYPNNDDFKAAYAAWKKEHPMPTGSIHDVVDHIEHIIKVAGIDHVGLGSDYDGISTTPRQLEDVSCYPLITQELLNRGHSREAIHKILGGNTLRALRDAETVTKTISPRPAGGEGLGVRGVSFTDIDGRMHTPLSQPDKKGTIFFFVLPDCPVSNAYAPEIKRICDDYSKKFATFVVHVDPDVTSKDAKKHAKAYGLTGPILLDPTHILVRQTEATIAPEAAVLGPNGTLLYRGRIDDLYSDVGTRRPEPTQRDLRVALDAIAVGKNVPTPRTKAVGCFLPEPRK
jgi:membrane dipeptidase